MNSCRKATGFVCVLMASLLLLLLIACSFVPSKTTPVPVKGSELGISSTPIALKDGMVFVPAGNFLMGSVEGEGMDNERPQHTVFLDDFWIDQTEVTNAEYKMCVGAGSCTLPLKSVSTTRDSYYNSRLFEDYPVIYVVWDQADGYCQWAGKRLPTEAEWEKAARGTDGRIYPWGNQPPASNYLNYEKSTGDTTAVGSFPAGVSPYGALDMAGNVWEWVADWLGAGYYRSQNDWNNPIGPSSGETRVLRGGSVVNSSLNIVRSATRGAGKPNLAFDLIGFPCARSNN
jgi:formylglycine-generating enzyme required for sulfatase activity